jgi:hypothetical protein
VEYTPGVGSGFDVTQKGEFQWVHDMLGWPPGQLQRNIDRMEHWINKGVKVMRTFEHVLLSTPAYMLHVYTFVRVYEVFEHPILGIV